MTVREQLPDEATSHAVREYLAVLDDAAFGGATPVAPKQLAVADPAARWTAASRERAFFVYSTNYLIDLEHAVIVDVEATTSVRQAEVTAQRRMIERAQDRFGLWPERLAADAGYGDAANLAWLVADKGIEPHIPVFDKSARSDGTFERSAFTFDREDDSYICPGGKRLRQRQKIYRDPRPFIDENGLMRYRASKLDCDACWLKPRCCPNAPARKILRSIHEGARDMARDIATSDAYITSRRQRKKVEMLVRAPQTHPQARPLAPAGTERSKRRVSPRRHRPEPPQNGQAHPDADAAGARLSATALVRTVPAAASASLAADFFNRIDPIPDIRSSSVTQ